MRHLKTVLALTVIFSCAVQAGAQRRKRPARSAPAERSSAPKDLKYVQTIDTVYDPATNTSVFRVDVYEVYDRDDQTISLAALHVYEGTEMPPPESLYLMFYSRSSEWKLLGVNNVVATADGRRFYLGGGRREMKRDEGEFSRLAGFRSENLLIPISFPTFQKIVKSKVVGFQMGEARFKLTAQDLRELRKYAGRLVK